MILYMILYDIIWYKLNVFSKYRFKEILLLYPNKLYVYSEAYD